MGKVSSRFLVVAGICVAITSTLLWKAFHSPTAAAYRDIDRAVAACALGFNSEASVKLGIDFMKGQIRGGQGLVTVDEIAAVVKDIKDDAQKIEAMKVIHACTKEFMVSDAVKGYVVQQAHVVGEWTASHADGHNGSQAWTCVQPKVDDGWKLKPKTGNMVVGTPAMGIALRNAELVPGAVTKDDEYNWCQTWYANRPKQNDGGVTHMETRAVAVQERRVALPPAPPPTFLERLFGWI